MKYFMLLLQHVKYTKYQLWLMVEEYSTKALPHSTQKNIENN